MVSNAIKHRPEYWYIQLHLLYRCLEQEKSVLWPGHCAQVFCIVLVFDKCWMVTGLVVSTVKTVVYFLDAIYV